jgi:hypothetical protein
MKQVLVLFTPTGLSAHVLQFAREMATLYQWTLIGVLLDDTITSDSGYPFPNDLGFTETETTKETEIQEMDKLREANIKIFRDTCSAAGIPYEIERNIQLKQLIELSKAAALILTDSRVEFHRFHLTEILHKSHCPVCLIYISAPEMKYIVLTYDGSDRSKKAIESFIRIFPKNILPAFLVSVNASLEVVEHKEFVNEVVKKHFPSLEMMQLEGKVTEELDRFILQFPKDAFVVMGAFGRSALSRLFQPSVGKKVWEETGASFFIAHNQD